MINACILINSLAGGGAEKVAAVLCEEYRRAGINVRFVCLEKNDVHRLESEVEYLSEYTGYHEGTITKLHSLYLFALQLKKIARRENISIVQSHIYRANYVNVLAGLLGSSHKTQLVNHGIASRYRKEGLQGKVNLFLIKWLYSRADQLIFPSKGMQEDLERIGTFNNKRAVIHNPFDIAGILEEKEVAISEDEFRFAVGRKYLVGVGRLEKVKRYTDTIQSVYILRESGIDINLILLGDGPEKENLNELATRLGVKDSVYFLGRVTNPFKYLARADIMISASEFEGFSNVIVEALICGTPVISTDCASGPREILAPGSECGSRLRSGEVEFAEYGVLVPVGDSRTMTDAIRKMLSQKDIMDKYSKKGIERARDFDKKVITGKYIDHIRDLVES